MDINDLGLPKPKHAGGRPSSYTPQIAQQICDGISSGKTIFDIIKKPGMPSKTTLLRWLSDPDNDEFRALHMRARQSQAWIHADLMWTIAKHANPKDAHAVRLRVDTLKWRCERFNRAAFGDVKQVNVSGSVDHKHSVLIAHVDTVLSEVYDLGLPDPDNSKDNKQLEDNVR